MSSVASRRQRGIGAGALFLAAVAAASCAEQNSEAVPADLIFTNAKVYTVETDQPWAEAVAIAGGKILAVGDAAAMTAHQGEETRIVDLGGRLVMPAFGDAHVHPVFGGMAYSRCSLHDGKTIEDYQRIIGECLEAHPGDGPVYGVGWQDALFPPKGVPRKEYLDAVTTERALIFESVGGHSYWVNSKTLELAGIDRNTPDPANGHIDRDENGDPVGGLQEAATELVSQFIPKPTQEEIQQSIVYTGKLFNSLGITNWRDAGIDLAADGTSETMAAYKAVKDRGDLAVHATLDLRWANDRGLDQIPAIVEASARAKDWGLTAASVKFYVDGVIPQRTAAMIDPYEGGDERGPLQIEPDMLAAAVTRLGADNIQSHVHAIGDRATRIGLDAFEQAKKENGDALRPLISHLNVIDPEDQPRFGELGAIAVFQPTWSSNYPYMDLTKQAIGPERSAYIYPAKSVLDGGGMLAYGADWPVATADPLWGLQVAVTRVNYEEPDTAPLLSKEAVTLEEAVRAHTLDVAYANRMEDATGSIAPGKSADIIVLDANIFELPAMEIGSADVILTLFEGDAVYGTLDRFGAGASE